MGVVIVTYNSDDVIVACLDSLLASDHPALHIVVCDNASTDGTVAAVRDWARNHEIDLTDLPANSGPAINPGSGRNATLLRNSVNSGFAAGVNLGLNTLLPRAGISHFWVLNPDSVVRSDTASAFAAGAIAAGRFSLMGGRTLYLDPPGVIQSDGGRIDHWTGICRNVNRGRRADACSPPDPETLDFISGANLIASREFIERVGLMAEDYFLYYEEVDWAMRRGDLPLAFCPEAITFHHGGTSIGTGSVLRRPTGFANYFNQRNRMRFVRRFLPALSWPVAYLASLARILKLVGFGAWSEIAGALRGLHGLPPPRAVQARLSPEAAALAFKRGMRD